MTEKRFTFTQDTLAKADVFDGSEFVCCTLSVWVEQLVDLLNQLNDENEQLRQRNTNQYNQLTELWEIIEEENWKKLIAMKKQLKEDEERLQKEWGCYE